MDSSVVRVDVANLTRVCCDGTIVRVAKPVTPCSVLHDSTSVHVQHFIKVNIISYISSTCSTVNEEKISASKCEDVACGIAIGASVDSVIHVSWNEYLSNVEPAKYHRWLGPLNVLLLPRITKHRRTYHRRYQGPGGHDYP